MKLRGDLEFQARLKFVTSHKGLGECFIVFEIKHPPVRRTWKQQSRLRIFFEEKSWKSSATVGVEKLGEQSILKFVYTVPDRYSLNNEKNNSELHAFYVENFFQRAAFSSYFSTHFLVNS